MNSTKNEYRWAWQAALACFIVAATTGALLRFGMINGLPEGLHLHNLRHAHSHLMYFGWTTPAFMALIAANLPQMTQRSQPRYAGMIIKVVFAMALLAYVAFLFFGYQPVRVSDASLPLSTIGAALNVMAWYGFIVVYWRATKGTPRFMPLRLWDAALIFMVLASCGAWGIALATAAGLSSPILSLALTHLFLDLFADGWFLLALLGIAAMYMPSVAADRVARYGENLLVAGLPLTFLLSLPAGALPAAVRTLAGISAILAASGLLILLYVFAKQLPRLADRAQRWLWGAALFFLTLKAVAFLITSLPIGAAWSVRMGMRISYLHWLLLGGVSLGLLAAARAHWGPRVATLWQPTLATIVVLLVSLIPLTRLWPVELGGRWTLQFAAWATPGPVIMLILMLLRSMLHNNESSLEAMTTRQPSSVSQ